MRDDAPYYRPHSGDDESWIGCSLTQGRGIQAPSDFVRSANLKSRQCFYLMNGCRRSGSGQGSHAVL